jgi:hypothetical protein
MLVLLGPDTSGQLLERTAVAEGRSNVGSYSRPNVQVPVSVADGAAKLTKDRTLLQNMIGLVVHPIMYRKGPDSFFCDLTRQVRTDRTPR